jgi:hypothetical protein
LSPAPKFKPPSFEGPRHNCGCHSKGAVRLQSASGDLRTAIGGGQKEDALDTVINIALVGGAVYLVYKVFFD